VDSGGIRDLKKPSRVGIARPSELHSPCFDDVGNL
jgi:hypothetical protein